MLRKMLKTMKNNFLGFVIGAIIFSGIGYVVAATIQSSNVSYTTNKNTSITNVKQAVDELYNKLSNSAQMRYWNSTQTFESAYNSREELINAYGATNFNNRPFYLKAAVLDDYAKATVACIFYNNNEFCYRAYSFEFVENWENNIKNSLKINDIHCGGHSSSSVCMFGNARFACKETQYSGGEIYKICGLASFSKQYNSNGDCKRNCDNNNDGYPDVIEPVYIDVTSGCSSSGRGSNSIGFTCNN